MVDLKPLLCLFRCWAGRCSVETGHNEPDSKVVHIKYRKACGVPVPFPIPCISEDYIPPDLVLISVFWSILN